LDRLSVPREDFDYDEFVKEEFGQPGKQVRPRGISWFWWVIAIIVTVAFVVLVWPR
jgi:hypothetical protein